jgi:hypothetical protein
MKKRAFSILFIVMVMITTVGIGLSVGQTCQSGGPGASECQYERTLTILGIPIIDQKGPKVVCRLGTYACCGPSTAVCISDNGDL